MSYLICLPSIWPPFTKACLESMNPLARINTLVIDNTIENKGVAASWNVGRQLVLRKRFDWLVILSAGVRFGPSGGTDFVDTLDTVPLIRGLAMAGDGTPTGTLGWRLAAIRYSVLVTVGPFDEQFFPAYMEDVDYGRRFGLAYNATGVFDPKFTTHFPCDAYPAPVIDNGELIGTSAHGICLAHIPVDFVANEERYGRKWGCPPFAERDGQADRGETFSHPYNRRDLSWSYVGEPK